MTSAFIDRYFLTTRPDAEFLRMGQFGYCVKPDGTILALTKAFWHGVLLVCLNPELAAAHGFKVPDTEDDVLNFVRTTPDNPTWVREGVYAYQDFELEFGKKLPYIRVGTSPLVGMAVDRGCDPATPAQMASLRLIFAEYEMDSRSEVATSVGDLKLPKVWDYLSDLNYSPLSSKRGDYDD